mgnify:CR=1 FL=1
MTIKIQDPISALTHFLGALLSLVAVTYLVIKAYYLGSPLHVIGFGIFGLSLVFLYSASTTYHIMEQPKKMSRIMKRIDHMMIFVLIAGTYTPVCLIPLQATNGGQTGLTVLVVVWIAAILGVFLKLFWINAPRWLSTLQYILMGWIAIFAIFPLFNTMTRTGFILLIAGGIIYTLGGLIYGTKWPRLKGKWFGFHEVFHLFVMGGSICHYFMVLTLI